MGCQATAQRSRREIIMRLQQRAGSKAMARARLAICMRASPCGRICTRLIKGPGIANVACVNIATAISVPLYEALENPDYVCPENRF